MAYQGKVAIVTGGTSGIGLGIAEHLAQGGASVVISARREDAGAKAVAELKAKDLAVHFYRADIASWEDQCDLFSFTLVKFKRIDLVFANAGTAQMRAMRTSDPAMFACADIDDLDQVKGSGAPSLEVLDVNLAGTLYSTYLSLAYFRKQDKDKDGWRGKLIITSSCAAVYPHPNDVLYATSKTALVGTVRALGPKVIEEGITVNCLAPSVVATAISPPEFHAMLRADGRITPMSTITDCVDILASPTCRLTGQTIENAGTKNVLRAIPPYLSRIARENMGEFHDVGQIDLALDQAGYEVL